MEQIREYLKRPLYVGILAFIVGLIIGWMVIGWLIVPVQWTNASPAELHPGYQDIWMRMAVISYGKTGDAANAKLEYEALGNASADTLERVKTNPGGIDPNLINQFGAAVSANVPQAQTTPKSGSTPTSATGTTGKSNLTTLLVVMCGVTLLVAAAIVAYFLLQGRKRSTGAAPVTSEQAPGAEIQAPTTEWTNYPAPSGQAPMAQFMASYKAGDDLFDDSFSIDSPSGEFLGECGVGISETIGVGVPKKVTAFEVWLFDKNDIQTVTKVLMSAHAFNDAAIRQKLEAKGEPFEANSGGQTILETATLKLVARVVDMAYGQGALPENSYFDSLVLELAIWQKQ
jgi:uncharacterized membrane protein YciS (DUF1049 family)